MHKISLHNQYALKGQGLQLAQGIALGDGVGQYTRPERAKAGPSPRSPRLGRVRLLPLQGETIITFYTQGDALGYELSAPSGRTI